MTERSCRDIAKKHLFVLCCSQCPPWLMDNAGTDDRRQARRQQYPCFCMPARQTNYGLPGEAYREDMGTLSDGRAAYGRAKER